MERAGRGRGERRLRHRGPNRSRGPATATPDPEELALLAGRVPPMPGSERVDTELLAGLWQQTLEALGAAALGHYGVLAMGSVQLI